MRRTQVQHTLLCLLNLPTHVTWATVSNFAEAEALDEGVGTGTVIIGLLLPEVPSFTYLYRKCRYCVHCTGSGAIYLTVLEVSSFT